jgi:glycosyltransferase involved in cell wall biosynthesis
MRVLYLFTSYRGEVLEKAKQGLDHGNGFWGMLRLAPFGVEADYAEVEQVYPRPVANFIRRYLSVYWIHVPVFFKFFSYDFIFTSTAYGTQLIHTLLHIRRPRWVMHDFSITGLIGREKTFKQKMFAYITSRAAGVVTLSIEEKEKLEKRFPHLRDKIEFIPFGVDLDFFKPMNIEQDGKIFAVGFDPDRDWKTFFKAVEGIETPVVAATRPQRVAKLQVPPNVSIKQFVPRDLAKEYAKSAVIVVAMDTSKGINDAMGCSTLFEAMATGKPVIATHTHTMASYVTDGENGLLVPEGDPEALKRALERLLADEGLRAKLGHNARIYAETHLDANKLGEKLAMFFKRLNAQQ